VFDRSYPSLFVIYTTAMSQLKIKLSSWLSGADLLQNKILILKMDTNALCESCWRVNSIKFDELFKQWLWWHSIKYRSGDWSIVIYHRARWHVMSWHIITSMDMALTIFITDITPGHNDIIVQNTESMLCCFRPS